MNVDKLVFAMAGTFLIISIILSQLHHVNWLWFTGFVGLNLLQSAFTGFCPAAFIFKKLGVKPGVAFA